MPDCQMDEIVLFLASDLIFENVFQTLEKVLGGKNILRLQRATVKMKFAARSVIFLAYLASQFS